MKNYNPYDLVDIILNDHRTFGRPVEFSAQIVDHKNLTDAFGNVVKPTKLSTTCADCGQGYLLDVDLGEPPFTAFRTNCPICRPKVIIPIEPFVDPVGAGLIQEHQINPSLADINKELKQVESTVAERLPAEVLKQVDDKSTKIDPEITVISGNELQSHEETQSHDESDEVGRDKIDSDQASSNLASSNQASSDQARNDKTGHQSNAKGVKKIEPESIVKKDKTAKPKAEKTKSNRQDNLKKNPQGDFIDHGKKIITPRVEEITPEIDLDSLED